MKRLKGNNVKGVCLIIGAGPGIGRSCGLEFAQEGYDIALAARVPARLDGIAADIQNKWGKKARTYAVDAASPASIKALVDAVRADMGHIEIAIYNAAAPGRGLPSEVSAEALVEDFKVNVAGALCMAQNVAPAMVAAGRGTILLTGGGLAEEPAAAYTSNSLGKAALRNLTYSLAQEYGRKGLHVATVTVHGFVQAGTHFDPQRIAKAFTRLHRQHPGGYDIEVSYK